MALPWQWEREVRIFVLQNRRKAASKEYSLAYPSIPPSPGKAISLDGRTISGLEVEDNFAVLGGMIESVETSIDGGSYLGRDPIALSKEPLRATFPVESFKGRA